MRVDSRRRRIGALLHRLTRQITRQRALGRCIDIILVALLTCLGVGTRGGGGGGVRVRGSGAAQGREDHACSVIHACGQGPSSGRKLGGCSNGSRYDRSDGGILGGIQAVIHHGGGSGSRVPQDGPARIRGGTCPSAETLRQWDKTGQAGEVTCSFGRPARPCPLLLLTELSGDVLDTPRRIDAIRKRRDDRRVLSVELSKLPA